MSQLTQAYQTEKETQEELFGKFFRFCALGHGVVNKENAAGVVSCLAGFWEAGCRHKDLAEKNPDFANVLETIAQEVAEGQKGKCTTCTDYLLLGAAEYSLLLSKRSRLEEYNSMSSHMDEFEYEESPVLARHLFVELKGVGGDETFRDPCNLFPEPKIETYVDDWGDEMVLTNYKWYSEDRGQQQLFDLCVKAFSALLEPISVKKPASEDFLYEISDLLGDIKTEFFRANQDKDALNKAILKGLFLLLGI